jgi:hypothetical protein
MVRPSGGLLVQFCTAVQSNTKAWTYIKIGCINNNFMIGASEFPVWTLGLCCSSVRPSVRVFPLSANLVKFNKICRPVIFLSFGLTAPQWAMVLFTSFVDITQRRTTVCRTPMDEGSARRRDLYLTTLTTDKHPCLR